MVTALSLRASSEANRVGILDFDMHYGDGTDRIIEQLQIDWIVHHSDGKAGTGFQEDALPFLARIDGIVETMRDCDVILYQAGADPHIDDPLGGWLTTGQLFERDRRVFMAARRLGIPIAWNLAGGYQKPLRKVLDIHDNTMLACSEVFLDPTPMTIRPKTKLRPKVNPARARSEPSMKLILSRKGFDGGSGGCPSPIFPDGSMMSLPIPFPNVTHRMQLATRNNSHFLERDIVEDLTAKRYDRLSCVHLDPYLTKYDSTPGDKGWRQAFGQDGAAQGHLSNQEVAAGDLFLFFGWFRRVEKVDEGWKYVRTSPAVHALFGWLRIQKILDQEAISARSGIPPWLSDHPHVLYADRMMNSNTVYFATERLIVGGKDFGPGGGIFGRFDERLQLTAPPAPGRGHSYWRLPRWFHPDFDATPTLTFHGRPDRWSTDSFDEAHTGLQTAARGQEFVIDLQGKRADEATKWLTSIFRSPT